MHFVLDVERFIVKYMLNPRQKAIGLIMNAVIKKVILLESMTSEGFEAHSVFENFYLLEKWVEDYEKRWNTTAKWYPKEHRFVLSGSDKYYWREIAFHDVDNG